MYVAVVISFQNFHSCVLCFFFIAANVAYLTITRTFFFPSSETPPFIIGASSLVRLHFPASLAARDDE